MPRADDPHLRFVERIASRRLVVVEELTNGGNDEALAHRTAHVRAAVFIGEQLALHAKNADRRVADVDDQTTVLRNVGAAGGKVPERRGSGGWRHGVVDDTQFARVQRKARGGRRGALTAAAT